MNNHVGLFAACVALGITLGIGLALVRPGSIRQLAKKLGLPDANLNWFHDQTLAFHKRIDPCVPDNAVLFIGDSSIQGLCVTEIADHAINYGIGGDTTEDLLSRLPEYESLTRARAVVFSIGDNDLLKGRTEEEIIGSYRRILVQMPKKVSVFFCSLTPGSENPKHELMNRDVESLNREIKQLSSSRAACHFVDLASCVSNERGFLLAEYADTDGVHLNGRGYRVCIEKLNESLQSAIVVAK